MSFATLFILVVSHRNWNVLNPTNSDILCGRDNHGRTYPGNIWCGNQFTAASCESYQRTTPRDRRAVVSNIKSLAAIEHRRFLNLEQCNHVGIVLYAWVPYAKTQAKIAQKYRYGHALTINTGAPQPPTPFPPIVVLLLDCQVLS
mmetsp:Transcript_2195/g.3448  ORF Transcript_2195/g.3448 Transcript_2195/m.3448 type:complete len:145 (+) Transcript_2195:123-557(+)